MPVVVARGTAVRADLSCWTDCGETWCLWHLHCARKWSASRRNCFEAGRDCEVVVCGAGCGRSESRVVAEKGL